MESVVVLQSLNRGLFHSVMPDLDPVQDIKLGASLLQNAVNRAVVVSRNAGVRALLVHAIHSRAKQFYEHYGFQPSPMQPMTLMLRLNTGKP